MEEISNKESRIEWYFLYCNTIPEVDFLDSNSNYYSNHSPVDLDKHYYYLPIPVHPDHTAHIVNHIVVHNYTADDGEK